MKRAAITIIYEGLHHLQHKQMTEKMISMFDYWIIVEGFARNGGSSKHTISYIDFPTSTDGTVEYCENLMQENRGKVIFYSSPNGWDSKDTEFNFGLDILSMITTDCFLWQVDADEQWNEDQLSQAENDLILSGANSARFQFNQFIGYDKAMNQLVARGGWGSDFVTRLWRWKGELFISHCPPVMENQTSVDLDQVYDHYAYQFKQDVMFKTKYYRGYKTLFRRWLRMQSRRHDYPMSLSVLMGHIHGTGGSLIYVHKNIKQQDYEKC